MISAKISGKEEIAAMRLVDGLRQARLIDIPLDASAFFGFVCSHASLVNIIRIHFMAIFRENCRMGQTPRIRFQLQRFS